MVQNSKTIIVTDGSPSSVNILFSKNSDIIILNDNIIKKQVNIYEVYKYIFERIIEKNELNIKYTKDMSVHSLIDILNI